MENRQGIDWGLGRTNRDPETGIRYGVVSCHSLNPDAIYETIDEGSDYGPATCPECSGQTIEHEPTKDYPDEYKSYTESGCSDWVCESCQLFIDSEFSYPEEPIGWSYTEEGYKLTGCLQNDVFVLSSPFYTFAHFCSPCVPGAGNLDSPIEIHRGLKDLDSLDKVYCLGHDWFEGNRAPYTVFRVSDNEEVSCEQES